MGSDPTYTISARDLAELRQAHDRPGSIARILFEELDATHDALRQAERERDDACAARDRVLEHRASRGDSSRDE